MKTLVGIPSIFPQLFVLGLALTLVGSFGSCTYGRNAQRGTAIGAVGGAVAGGLLGGGVGSAALGAGVGAFGGNVIGGERDHHR